MRFLIDTIISVFGEQNREAGGGERRENQLENWSRIEMMCVMVKGLEAWENLI